MDTIFVDRERAYHRGVLQICSHDMADPVACIPSSGWENGQVKNQVGLVRERFFTPHVRVKSYDELNAWLLDQCVANARAHRHHEIRDRTVWEIFEADRPSLGVVWRAVRQVPQRVGLRSKTCLVRFDNNRYSVSAHAIGRLVENLANAERIQLRQAGLPVGEHVRCFGREQTVFGLWHYVPVLAREPSALRNGSPFKHRLLPAGLGRVRRKLAGSADGSRQMVGILTALLSDDLTAVEAACLEAPTAEISGKQAHSIRYQIAIAKVPLAKDVDDFAFNGTSINEMLVRDLAGGNFVAPSPTSATLCWSVARNRENSLGHDGDCVGASDLMTRTNHRSRLANTQLATGTITLRHVT